MKDISELNIEEKKKQIIDQIIITESIQVLNTFKDKLDWTIVDPFISKIADSVIGLVSQPNFVRYIVEGGQLVSKACHCRMVNIEELDDFFLKRNDIIFFSISSSKSSPFNTKLQYYIRCVTEPALRRIVEERNNKINEILK